MRLTEKIKNSILKEGFPPTEGQNMSAYRQRVLDPVTGKQ